MYRNVIVFDGETGRKMDFSISPNDNKFNGYVEDSTGSRFLFEDRDSKYEAVKEIPTYYTEVLVNHRAKAKPSIYRRPFLACRREEYKYAFTNTITKTTKEIHDVYYNSRRDRFLDKVRTNNWFSETYGFQYE